MLARWIAALVLCSSMLQPQISAYLATWATSDLPACCRADGKHHCAMSARLHDEGQSGEKRIRAATDPCPYRSLHLATVGQQLAALAHSSQFQLVRGAEQSVISADAHLARNAQFRNYPKRGPPLLG